MPCRKIYFIGFVLPLCSFISCLHSRTAPPSFAIEAGIKISYGNASLKIDGKINENLYYFNPFGNQIKDEKYYENPFIEQGAITKNETKHLVTGDEYTFSVLPTEVVSVNIVSSDGNDVEIIACQYGNRKKYTIKGTDRLGLFLAFQHR
ncbi:MAG: hypothetical protein LBD58_01840 [Treponema sp.]|nr:hypothetical protein [Treponema sp.]